MKTRTFHSTDIQNSTCSTFYDSIHVFKNSSQSLNSKGKVGDPIVRNNSDLRVVSYSLFSNSQYTPINNPRYTEGLIANIELIPLVYPGWQMWIYHDGNLPKHNHSIQRALQKPFVRLIDMSQSSITLHPSTLCTWAPSFPPTRMFLAIMCSWQSLLMMPCQLHS